MPLDIADFWFLLIPVAIVGFFFVLVVGVCLWEKRPLVPYEAVPEGGDEYEPSRDADRANDTAEDLGYTYLGVRHSSSAAKGVRVRYDFWLAPDRLTVAVVGSGTTLKVPVFAVWLWSRLPDGTLLCTADNIGEQYIAPGIEQQTWPKARFDALDEKHAGRAGAGDAVPFSDTPFRDMETLARANGERLVERGYAHFVGDPPAAWRYNLRGALAFYFTTVWVRPARRFLRSLGLVREG